MNGNGHDDKLGAAIAAVDQSKPVPMQQFQVTITSTGRPAAIALPADATDAEIAEVCGWILTAVINTYRQERAKKAGPALVIARGMPPRPSKEI